jgi:RNA polymerase sigma factor for flagellar operon FliA
MVATMTIADAWSRYLEEADAESREQIILQHTPLVKYVIGRLAIHLPQILDFEDVLAYGTLGLIQALDRFDPSRGVKFESYAVMRIRGAILDALRALRACPSRSPRRPSGCRPRRSSWRTASGVPRPTTSWPPRSTSRRPS